MNGKVLGKIKSAEFDNQDCKECCDAHLQLAHWMEELIKIKKENVKLKRLLKLAVEDMANGRPICENCKKLDTDECDPVVDCSCFE